MLLSIHDVPPYERHLLFCTKLDHRRSLRHGHRDHSAPALNVALTERRGRTAVVDPAPLAIGSNHEPVYRVAQVGERWTETSALLCPLTA
jgi:hypothetical protein